MNTSLHSAIRTTLLTALLLGGCTFAGAQARQPAMENAAQANAPQPDNTKANQQDRDSAQPTANNQKTNPGDLETTKQIRQAIYKDKSISTYGHDVKIITQDGKVTLRGPVRSQEEKEAIEAQATEIAGAGNVTDELEVKAKQ
jgi:hyperosmotically inducible periplasmic protein